jgi:beta-mannan synthase
MFWVLFENVMSLHRSKATIIGLLNLQSANEWIVTKKLGDTFRSKFGKAAAASNNKKESSWKIGERFGFYLF